MPAPNRPTPRPTSDLNVLRDPDWQMSFGERAALEGVLSELSPRLAIEIGTAEGGSLRRLAAHSEEVHAFDLSFELLDREIGRDGFDNVVFHAGDSHVLLGETLAEIDREGRQVDFALVDGDHSPEGVQRDVEDLLSSDAVADAVILVHDTMNERVREGLERVAYEDHARVGYVELDFVPGYMFREPSLRHELWGGLGLIVVESDRPRPRGQSPRQRRYFDAYELIADAKQTRLELERHQEWLHAVQGSASWRLTAPLRAAARATRRIREGRER
jgi:Methyltransferase domain